VTRRPGADLASEFDLDPGGAYLNHAASAPLPIRSATALQQYVRHRLDPTSLYQAGAQDYDSTALRAKLGRMLNAQADRIGFVPTTSDGIAGLLKGISWERGDNVVFGEGEYPSIVYAALALDRLGVEARQVPMPQGVVEVDRLLDAADGKTRAVVASFVHWQTGWRIDLGQLGRGCQSLGALSIVDGIQGMGVQPIDVASEPVDALVAGTYKWLCGVPGLAVLYVSRSLLERVIPDRAGWVSMATSVYAKPAFVWAEGAGRFSVGAPADPALVALEPSVDLLLEAGVEAISAHTIRLADAVADGASRLGLAVNGRASAAGASAIVNITTGLADRDLALVRDLLGRGIVVSRRGPGIRVAPHLHNREEDVERLLGAIADFVKTEPAR